MSTKGFWGSRLVAAVLLLGGLGAANAAVIRGNADPQFTSSGDLSGVFWTSTITFSIADGCVSPCLISPIAASFTLASSQGGSPLVSQNFPLFAPTSGAIHRTAGVVDAFDTPLIGASTLFTFNSGSLFFTGFAWIDWGIDANNRETAQFFIQQCPSSSTNWYVKHYNTACTPSFGGAAGSTIPATITVTQVPEPGAPLLLLTALSVLWFVRRRAALRR